MLQDREMRSVRPFYNGCRGRTHAPFRTNPVGIPVVLTLHPTTGGRQYAYVNIEYGLFHRSDSEITSHVGYAGSSPKFSGANRKGKSSPTKYAFPTVVDEVTILGVSVGITEVLLTVYGSNGHPVGKPKVIAKSDYAWDGSRLVVKRLAQDLKVKFSLEWTI